VVIEVGTCSFRSVRGYSFAAVIADEVAFWRDESSASPDAEVIAAIRPGLATLPGALLIGISSPYSRRGVLWESYRRHYGQDGDPVLVWQADTATMHPSLDPALIAAAYDADPVSAAAEYGGQFRSDLGAFVAREVVEAAVVPGRVRLPPVSGRSYAAFVDPSGGSQDSMTLAVAHDAAGVVVLDCVVERKPPFKPAEVVCEFADVLAQYRITTVVGDRYAGEWSREHFQNHGITYDPSEKPKSEVYGAFLPLLNSGQVQLLDVPRLHAQWLALERRTARGGPDSIDHAPGAHDDVANAVAGAAVTVGHRPPGWGLFEYYRREYERLRGDAAAP
jgi:hypothetical protein